MILPLAAGPIFKGAHTLPIADDAVDLFIVEEGTLQPLQFASVRGHEEHITAPQQPFRTRHIQDDATVDLAGDGKSNARREVGLDQTGDHIDGRALGGNNQVNTNGARHLRQATNMFLDFFRRGHHQVGHLINNDNNVGQRLLAAFGQVLIVTHKIARTDLTKEAIAPFHLFDGPEEHTGRLVHFGNHGAEQMGNAIVDTQLHHFGIDHQQA